MTMMMMMIVIMVREAGGTCSELFPPARLIEE